VVLNVICPFVNRNQEICVVGDCEELGNWNPALAKSLSYLDEGEWQIVLDAKKIALLLRIQVCDHR